MNMKKVKLFILNEGNTQRNFKNLFTEDHEITVFDSGFTIFDLIQFGADKILLNDTNPKLINVNHKI